MKWVRGEMLGQGSFGTVSLAKWIGVSSDWPQLLAVKSCGASCSASLMNEERILEELRDCPEIIRCYGDCYTHENGENLYNLFLEFASGGALADKVKNSSHRGLPEGEVRQYTKGIVRGLNYIHKNGFIHCDMKLQNILLTRDGAIKIADFGLAKRIGEEKEGNSGRELRGTPMYMSPEMVVGEDQGSPADIWALGCLVVEMLTAASVWRCSTVPDLLMRIGGGDEVPEIPAKLSEEGKDFINKCFIKDARRRWTAEMLLDHPFLASDDDHGGDEMDQIPSISPRCAFDFPDWVSQQSPFSSSFISLSSPEKLADSDSWFSGDFTSCDPVLSNSPVERLRRLVTGDQCNWSVWGDWATIR